MKKTLLLFLLFGLNFKMNSQNFHKIIPSVTQSTEKLSISKNDFYIVINNHKLDKALLDKCELFCDSIQKSDKKKYIDNTYTFYKKSNSLNESTKTSFENLYEKNINNVIAVLRYTRRINKPDKKMFLLLDNGESIKCYIDGIERKKRK